MATIRDRITVDNHEELFQKFYIPIAEAAINTATPFRTSVKRIKDFTGDEIVGAAKLSLGGGVGNEVIPQGSTYKAGKINYKAVALWGTCVLDWEAVVSTQGKAHSFVDATVDTVEGMLAAFTNNEERQFFGTHNGIIGVIDGNAPINNGDGTWTFTVSTATYFYPNWETGYVINFGSDGTPFEITRVVKSTGVITVTRRPGFSFDPAVDASTTDNLYMQNSKDKELIGLKEIADATDNGSTTLYGLLVQPRYEARRYNASSKPLIPDMLTEMIELQTEDTGETYTDIWMNAVQYTALSNQLEGKKEYTQLKSNDKRYADMGWKMLSFTSRYGDVRIGTARFCPKDRIYFTNKNYMEARERPQFGWLQYDGNKFLRDFREGDKPKYKAFYGGYEQFFHHPAHLGVIHTLEVPAIG